MKLQRKDFYYSAKLTETFARKNSFKRKVALIIIRYEDTIDTNRIRMRRFVHSLSIHKID